MKQVMQNVRSGALTVEDVPAPLPKPGGVMVRTEYSLISPGTERATILVAKKSLIGKAKERPDLVRKVLATAQTQGMANTARMVMGRLNSPVALGYSCAGVAVDVALGVPGVSSGDYVACAGQNYASHAEYVWVPANLCVRIPSGVSSEEACYVALGAIALQGIRQAAVQLGEVVAVVGLGLLGQLTVQMLKAAGCVVIASDLEQWKLDRARDGGADAVSHPGDLEDVAAAFSGGHGIDAVIVTASSKGGGPLAIAARISRRKGRVILVGDVRMDVPREHFYAKELDLRMSTSYGPGRYDPTYEERGHDYPYGYVRWTERRNMEAFLGLVATGAVNVRGLTTHRSAIGDAPQLYATLLSNAQQHLGVVISYPGSGDGASAERRVECVAPRVEKAVAVGLIGAGNHVGDVILPRLRGIRECRIAGVCTQSGLKAKALADRVGAEFCTTDPEEVFASTEVNVVVIGTRHDSHAELVVRALAAGKHVFVEKPLALNQQQLASVREAYEAAAPRGVRLTIGFNRRYSPHAHKVREALKGRLDPLVMNYRVNAGSIPQEHWIQDPEVGGGRIVGEACHFIDLMQYVCGARPTSCRASSVRSHHSGITSDHAALTVGFEDGSLGVLTYAAGGDKALPKERLEVFGGGVSAVIDDYKVTTVYSGGKARSFRTRMQDKGFDGEVRGFIQEIVAGAPPGITFEEIVAVSAVCIAAQESLDGLAPGGAV